MARTDPRPHYGSGRRVDTNGYLAVWRPGHPLARRDGYVFEHRLIMYEAGLLPDLSLQVHHLNGDKADNRLSNLEALTITEHARRHAAERWPLRILRPVKEARPCEGCPATVPATARADARFCSGDCRVRTFKRRRRAAA